MTQQKNQGMGDKKSEKEWIRQALQNLGIAPFRKLPMGQTNSIQLGGKEVRFHGEAIKALKIAFALGVKEKDLFDLVDVCKVCHCVIIACYRCSCCHAWICDDDHEVLAADGRVFCQHCIDEIQGLRDLYQDSGKRRRHQLRKHWEHVAKYSTQPCNRKEAIRGLLALQWLENGQLKWLPRD